MEKQKTKIGVICFIFYTVLFISSCDAINQVNSDATLTLTPQAIAPTVYVKPTDFLVVSLPTHQEVLEQMYGKEVDIYPTDKASIRTEAGITYEININLFSCHYERNTEVCLVIADRSYDGCHECGAHVDGAVFERNSKEW